MAFSFFKAEAIGNVGRDPEVKYTDKGMAIATFSVAASNRGKDRSGEWTDLTTWVRVTAFGKTAELIGDKVGKGTKVYISGPVNVREYETKDGKKGFSTDMNLNDFVILSGERSAAADEEYSAEDLDDLPI